MLATMNGTRRKFGPPSRLTDTQPQQHPPSSGSKPKTNRLSRSFRQTQQPAAAEGDSPKSCEAEFKTPTRPPRSRYTGGFTGESPHNDSEFQQDIIWDATSPSPNRPGKRGKKPASAAIVDISEIVSRIAPKHGRPKVAEPTLQQWIGDSAAIPCTPDVQLPKKKSPRPHGVDDLLKLAKQFDFNMFQQDEDELEDMHQQSLELLSGDILDSESGNENEVRPLLSETSQPAVNAAGGRDAQPCSPPDHHMEDDLDFLFDGPTQQISGNLSQISLARSSAVNAAPAVSSKEVSLKDAGPSHGHTTHTKGTSVDDFEDDWDNDDLLNDSLVFEITQNPQNFTGPKHCSTQRGSCEIQQYKGNAVNVPVRSQPGHQHGQSAASKAEKENVKHRISFRLETHPDFPVRRILTDASTNLKSVSDAQQSRVSSSKGLSIETGSQLNWQTHHSNAVKSNQQESPFHQRTSVANSRAKCNTASASASSNTSATKATKGCLMRPSPPEATSNHKPAEPKEVPAVPPSNHDFLDEDLDSFFSSDFAWDDQEDDDLLCEMCEDLESQVQSVESLSTEQTRPVGQTLNQRPALAPPNRVWDNMTQQTEVKQVKPAPTNPQSSGRDVTCMQSLSKKRTPTPLPSGSGRPPGNSFGGNYASDCTASLQNETGKESHRYMQANNTFKTSSSNHPQGTSIPSVAAPPLGNDVKDQSQFTFRRPNNPVTSKATGKCSVAEIKLKKHQAMERRRQRVRATQNLRAPT